MGSDAAAANDVRRDLSGTAASIAVDLTDLENEFTAHAKSYSDRKGITYMAWREVGVSAITLKNAGITRGST